MPAAIAERHHAPSITTLRALFRNLAAWRVLYEEANLDEISYGEECYSIHDVEYLVSQLHRLSPRQHQSIQLMLIDGGRECDVAVHLGLAASNPVGAYATEGIKKIRGWITEGSLPRFRVDA